MLLILLSQLIIATAIYTLLRYKQQLFSNVFWLACSIFILAFIPNFITSLYLAEGSITVLQSQILFSITGGIVLTFLYAILSKIKCN